MAAVEEIDAEAPTAPTSQTMATQGQGQPQDRSAAKMCVVCISACFKVVLTTLTGNITLCEMNYTVMW